MGLSIEPIIKFEDQFARLAGDLAGDLATSTDNWIFSAQTSSSVLTGL